jgi:hypothetical protein
MTVAIFTGSRDWTERAAVVSAFEHAEQHMDGLKLALSEEFSDG